MPMSCSVSPISARSVEALFGHKTPRDKSKTMSPPLIVTANYGWFMTLHWTLLGRFEVGDCYEYVGLSWVRKAAVWIQFNLQ